jgi:hypothetical protein
MSNPLSYITYSGTGSSATFTVPFPYIARAHVSAKVNGTVTPFTWDNGTTARFATPPASGAVIEIRRTTPRTTRLVDFQDASVLGESDLDLSAIQSLYISQEALDAAADAVAFAQGLEIASGNVPSPALADVGRFLRANAPGSVGWSSEPATDADLAAEVVNRNAAIATETNNRINFVAARLNNLTAYAFPNLLDNSGFLVNQREYVSNTPAPSNLSFCLDRWKIVVAGQSVTWAETINGRLLTAPAGGVEQVIEGANVTGGTYSLWWGGSATATVNGVVVLQGASFSLTTGANVTVRFFGGSVGNARLVRGSESIAWERRPPGVDEIACSRYFQRHENIILYRPVAGGSFGGGVVSFPFPVTMRATPTATFIQTGGNVTEPTPSSFIGTKGASLWWNATTPVVGDWARYTVLLSSDI